MKATLTITIDQDILNEFNQVSAEDSINKSRLVTTLIKEWLESLKPIQIAAAPSTSTGTGTVTYQHAVSVPTINKLISYPNAISSNDPFLYNPTGVSITSA